MAAAVILDFKNFTFLTVGHTKKVEMLHGAKCRRNCSNRGRDIAIFRHLGFLNFRIFNGRSRHECQSASPCQIWSKSLEPRLRYVSFENDY